jgi:ribosomal protein S18 acetylase RimI-like enzyme
MRHAYRSPTVPPMSPGADFEIIEVGTESEILPQVLKLHRAAKRYLGPLPDEGFEDRAVAGTLFGALSGGHLCGYVLYDLPANRVTIRHLCVGDDARGEGIARLLVEELVGRHPERLGIQLECRRDYPANEFWPKVGFRPVGERPGRSKEGLPLTRWLRTSSEPHQPDLFTVLAEERALAAVDQMVLEDLVCGGTHGEAARNLREAWVADMLELGATDQLFHESNDTPDAELRARLIAAARELCHLPSREPDGETLAQIAELAPGAGRGDHCHLARAIETGADYLLTRDGRLLRAHQRVDELHGIKILRPDQLIAELDRIRRRGPYEPVALEGTELQSSRLPAGQDAAFAAALLNTGARERAHEFEARVRRGRADTDAGEVVRITDQEGTILAGYVRGGEGDLLRVGLLRVAGRGASSRAIARQLAFEHRREAAARGLGGVVVEDSHLSPSVPSALESEAYVLGEGSWRVDVEQGVGTLAGADRVEAATIERVLWPRKVLGAGLPTYAVAIQPAFAERLFDSGLAEQTLFHRDLGLGLSREQVYYRKPNPGAFISAPARILWYVSGGRPGHPVGEVRAISQLAEVVVDGPQALCRRFERLGVWSFRQVSAAADRNGKVMALRVTDTELLQRPLALQEIQAACKEIGRTFRHPQSPVELDEQVLELIYRRSSAYVD